MSKKERANRREFAQTKRLGPAGIRLSPEKQIECGLPEKLAVLLTPRAFGQLFGFAYPTQKEVCLRSHAPFRL